MKIIYTTYNTKIIDSYKLNNKQIKKVVDEVYEYRKSHHMIYRSKSSYIREIKGHNRLYKIGYKRDHTKDADLEENQKIKDKIIWNMIGV